MGNELPAEADPELRQIRVQRMTDEFGLIGEPRGTVRLIGHKPAAEHDKPVIGVELGGLRQSRDPADTQIEFDVLADHPPCQQPRLGLDVIDDDEQPRHDSTPAEAAGPLPAEAELPADAGLAATPPFPAEAARPLAADGASSAEPRNAVYASSCASRTRIALSKPTLRRSVCDQPRDTGQPFVGIDDFTAIAPAAQALVDAGHTKVGILSIRLRHARLDGVVDRDNLAAAEFDTQRLRVQGALKTFADAGINADQIPVVTRHINNRDTAREAAEELLTNNPELTAVLCTTDSMALGVLDFAEGQGIPIPGDLSVTGFDGIESARLRGLTTVIQPNFEKGAEAGRMLAELIDASVANRPYPTDTAGNPLRVLLETQLAPGSTVASPRYQA